MMTGSRDAILLYKAGSSLSLSKATFHTAVLNSPPHCLYSSSSSWTNPHLSLDVIPCPIRPRPDGHRLHLSLLRATAVIVSRASWLRSPPTPTCSKSITCSTRLQLMLMQAVLEHQLGLQLTPRLPHLLPLPHQVPTPLSRPHRPGSRRTGKTMASCLVVVPRTP